MKRQITKIIANENMAKLRKEKGITRQVLADLTQVTLLTIYNYEKGIGGARHYNAKAIADVLECDIKDIFDWVKVDDKHHRKSQKRKITAEQVKEIRNHHDNETMTSKEMSQLYGITVGMINKICRGESWREVV